MPDNADPLARLGKSERQCLTLLSTGHDIKGVAAALDISVHAVNERLRSARRKLGTTSSREAARRLAARAGGAQEICTGKSGVENRSGARSQAASPTRWSRGKGALIAMMLTLPVAAAALVLIVSDRHPAPPPPAPRVVQTVPGSGAVIAPGAFTLTVTFDQPMQPGSYSFVQPDPAAYPVCTGDPAQSRDGRSFSLRCHAERGRAYAVGFNSARFRNFRSHHGVPAVPVVLRFTAR